MKSYIITTENNYGRKPDLTYYPKALPKPDLFYGVTKENFEVPEWWLNIHGENYDGQDSRGIFCCGKSKELLLRQHKEQYPDEDALLMEDDVFFIPEASEKYDRFMESVPNDWALIYLGGWHSYNTKGMYPLEVKPGVLRVFMDAGNEALIVRANVIDEVIEHITHSPVNVFTHVDWHLTAIQHRHPCYSPLGYIAGQQDGYSVICRYDRKMGIWNDFLYEGIDRKVHAYGNPRYDCAHHSGCKCGSCHK